MTVKRVRREMDWVEYQQWAALLEVEQRERMIYAKAEKPEQAESILRYRRARARERLGLPDAG